MDRKKKAEADPESAYAEFFDLVEQAKAHAEMDNVRIIKRASKKTWTAAAWLLERAYPERWGRRDAVVTTGDVQHRVIFEFSRTGRIGQDDDDADEDNTIDVTETA